MNKPFSPSWPVAFTDPSFSDETNAAARRLADEKQRHYDNELMKSLRQMSDEQFTEFSKEVDRLRVKQKRRQH